MHAHPVVLVTGAAGGIGRAVIARLQERRFVPVATDAALADLPCSGPVAAFPLDVRDEAAVRAAVGRVVDEYGRLDHVVHLAGRAAQGAFDTVSRAEWDAQLALNLSSAFTIAQAAHPHLAAVHGSLVLTASTNALNGGSALSGPAYAVAKAGIVNLTRHLAREWAPQGIRVNCLAPGPIDTAMTRGRLSPDVMQRLRAAVPLGMIGEPKHVAHAVDYLLHPDAAFVTGTVLNISGGLVID